MSSELANCRRSTLTPHARRRDCIRRPRACVPRPTVGERVNFDAATSELHETAFGLVAVGDSLTHGLTSGAVHLTDRSWPALVAEVLGLAFAHPTYDGPLDGTLNSSPPALVASLFKFVAPFATFFVSHSRAHPAG